MHCCTQVYIGVQAKKFCWGGHDFARLAPKAREPLGRSGGMLQQKILKNSAFLMPFPAFWCGFLCMEQVTNETKILRIFVKQI